MILRGRHVEKHIISIIICIFVLFLHRYRLTQYEKYKVPVDESIVPEDPFDNISVSDDDRSKRTSDKRRY